MTMLTITVESYHTDIHHQRFADALLDTYRFDPKNVVEIRVHDDGAMIEVDQVWYHHGAVQTVPDGDGRKLDIRTCVIEPRYPSVTTEEET